MDPQRWARIESLYHAALAKTPDERPRYLAAVCSEDPEIQREVESLLDCADSQAANQPGPDKRLGPYEILGLLGAGGMGEVYRAMDTRLRREVAIKLLPREFQNDPARLARFEREAQVLASLNHPRIAAIYGLEEFQGKRFLVLELVEGPTLADRLRHSPIPEDEALAIAGQIIEAMEYAHERGVIHRDLKPANIKLTADGNVKVLDFGLAKALAGPASTADPAESPTVTIAGTAAGVILGTAAYMSPEQACGKPLDKRTDIWSFGVVLYEMLTRRQPFQRDSVPETLASVLKEAPDLNPLPARSQHLLRSCLQKDPKQRLHDIADARLLLEELPASPGVARQSRLGWIVAAVALTALAVTLAWLYLRPAAEQKTVLRFSILPPEKTSFERDTPAISPDGRHLALVVTSGGRNTIWLRDLDSLTFRPLPGSEQARYPFWSPDSRYLAFFTDSSLKKIDLAATYAPGPPLIVCNCFARVIGGSWGKGDVILFTPGSSLASDRGLYRIPAGGGPLTQITHVARESELFHAGPWFLPDGRHFLYQAVHNIAEENATFLGDLDSKTSHLVVTTNSPGVYASPGYLLFTRDRTLMAQPFDATRDVSTGDPVAILAEPIGVRMNGLPLFSSSQNGVLVYASSDMVAKTQLTWFDRSGKIGGKVGEPGPLVEPAISPDGNMVAFTRHGPTTDKADLWLHDMAHGSLSRFTVGPEAAYHPVWSPDGTHIAFRSRRFHNLYERAVSGPAQEDVLDAEPESDPDDWSRDGRYIIEEKRGKTGFDIWVLPLFGDRKPFPYLTSEFNEKQAKLSPDGHWLAYVSDQSQRDEVYVTTFPKRGTRWPVSTGGGAHPVWSRNGKELYFISATQKMMAAEVKAADRFDYATPQALFDVRISPYSSFDVSPDGRFLIPVPLEDSAGASINVVMNWPAILKR